MSELKTIWVFSCSNESGDRWVEGFFTKKLTEEEQHGYFKDYYEYAIEDGDDEEDRPICYIHWELIEMDLQKIPESLCKEKWSRTL